MSPFSLLSRGPSLVGEISLSLLNWPFDHGAASLLSLQSGPLAGYKISTCSMAPIGTVLHPDRTVSPKPWACCTHPTIPEGSLLHHEQWGEQREVVGDKRAEVYGSMAQGLGPPALLERSDCEVDFSFNSLKFIMSMFLNGFLKMLYRW